MSGRTLHQARHERLAFELAAMGARTALVTRLTGVSAYTVRDMIREATGAAPKPGALPTGVATICSNATKHLQGSIFLTLFRATRRTCVRLSAEDLSESYRAFAASGATRSENGDVLTIEAAAVLAEEFRVGHTALKRCRTCGGAFLVLTEEGVRKRAAANADQVVRPDKRLTKCPFCRLAPAWHCSCGARMDSHGRCTKRCDQSEAQAAEPTLDGRAPEPRLARPPNPTE